MQTGTSISTKDWELIATRLPYGVFSEDSVLGASLDMNVGTLPGKLLFPGTRDGLRLTPPPGPPSWYGHPEHSSHEPDWGRFNGQSRSTIRTVVFHVDHTYFDDGRPTYPDGFPKLARTWLTRLSDWLDVLADGTTQVIGPGSLTWQNWDIEIEALNESLGDMLEPKYALSLEQWRFAVNRTSAGESAPFPLALIAAAQRSAAEGDYRRAVFDAASAAETALKDSLHRAVLQQGMAPAFYEWAMYRKTFGVVVDVSEKMGLTLPPETSKRLVNVRNRVAHPSSIPTEAEMLDAVVVAAEIIGAHFLVDPPLRAAMQLGASASQP